MGIKVWAKWQSSPVSGDGAEAGVKGNRLCGDAQVPAWENLLDLKPQYLPMVLPPAGVFLCVHMPCRPLRRASVEVSAMNAFWKRAIRFSIAMGLLTLVLTILITVVSTALLSGVDWTVGLLIVLGFILLGIAFDAVGLAAAAGDEVSLRAMAAERIPGAKRAIFLVREADRVSSFCNDVIGDISGIVSGVAGAAVVFQLTAALGYREGAVVHTVITVLFTAVIAALTVGGKALGKVLALKHHNAILLRVGRLFDGLERVLGVSLLHGRKGRKRRRGNGKPGGSRAKRSIRGG